MTDNFKQWFLTCVATIASVVVCSLSENICNERPFFWNKRLWCFSLWDTSCIGWIKSSILYRLSDWVRGLALPLMATLASLSLGHLRGFQNAPKWACSFSSRLLMHATCVEASECFQCCLVSQWQSLRVVLVDVMWGLLDVVQLRNLFDTV